MNLFLIEWFLWNQFSRIETNFQLGPACIQVGLSIVVDFCVEISL